MKEINFYFPLSIVYDGDHNYVGNMFAAKHYQEEILKEFDKFYCDEDMTEYFYDGELKEKIHGIFWNIVVIKEELVGKVVVLIDDNQNLSKDEIEEIKDFIEGQNSDGLGESFEQREIRTHDGELIYVSFWDEGDYKIYTEELTKMEAKEELIRNVSTEYKNLYKNWMTKTPENLVASAYDINFLQEWHIMLTEDCFYDHVDEAIVEWLCSFDEPLQALLEIFLGCDCPSSYSWDDMIDWIEIVYSDATSSWGEEG